MAIWPSFGGIMNTLFRIGGPISGLGIKYSASKLQFRNAADNGFAGIEAYTVRLSNGAATGSVLQSTDSSGNAAWVNPDTSGGVGGWYAGDVKMAAQVADHGKWLFCNGRDVSRTTYATLFALIGTTYGAGDGSTTFTIPDFRGYSPRGAFVAGDLTGVVGADTVTLVQGNLPANTVVNGGATALVSSGGSTAASLKAAAATSFSNIPATKRLGMFIYTG